MSDSIRIVEMPDLGTVTDASSVVGERSGSGRFGALALKNYVATGLGTAAAIDAETAARVAAATGISAKSYGTVGNGVADDTAALQAAINAAIAQQQTLYIPGGRYLISAPLTINRGVRITGAYVEPAQALFTAPVTPPTGAGTWITLDGSHLVSAFVINPSGTPSANNQALGVELSHFGVYHTQPAPAPSWAPYNYPPAIDIPAGSDIYLHHLCLLNPTIGIRAAGQSAGRVVLDRIVGQPLTQGIVLDNQQDIVTIRDVHFWVYWSLDANVLAWQKANGRALNLGRVDDPVIDNFFCIWYWIGVNLAATAAGNVSNARLTNCDFDECGNPFVINDATGGHTVFLSGCNLGCPASPIVSTSCLTIEGGGSSSVVLLTGCWLGNAGNSSVWIASSGNHVRLAACNLHQWDQLNGGAYALQSAAGSIIRADAETVAFSTIGPTHILAGGQCLKAPGLWATRGQMPAAGTSVVLPHLLGATPDITLVTPNGGPTVSTLQWWAVADASNVTVQVSAAPAAAVNFSVLLGLIN
jgi:hypothetical protein